MQAQFITLDGIDGAGKSTNLNVIRNWFDKRRLPLVDLPPDNHPHDAFCLIGTGGRGAGNRRQTKQQQ